MIPQKLTNFMCYNRNREMMGVVDAVLPNFQYMTESMSGAGIAGEIDSPVIGHFQSLTATINFRVPTAENLTLLAPETHHFDMRGNIQLQDERTGQIVNSPVRAIIQGMPKGLNVGNLGVGIHTGTSLEIEVTRIQLSANNRNIIEVDKINFRCIINGIDYLAPVRRNMGLS